jgi:hypothetical protein
MVCPIAVGTKPATTIVNKNFIAGPKDYSIK